MFYFPIPEQLYLLKILKLNYKSLFRFHGVHYVDIGYKFVKRNLLPILSVRIHVHKKLPKHLIDPVQILPQYIHKVPIDVIQSNPGFQRMQPNIRSKRFNPLIGGIAIHNPRYNTVGTLGCITYDNVSHIPLGLSNFHVLVGELGKQGDIITQPATEHHDDIIGNVIRWNEDLDCAVFALNNSREFSPGVFEYNHSITGLSEPFVGMQILKSGLTTGITEGIIDGISLDDFTIVPLKNPEDLPSEISAPGDSGSIWLEKNSNKAIGLHYAGETDPAPEAERAWAKRLTKVCPTLNINLTPTQKIKLLNN